MQQSTFSNRGPNRKQETVPIPLRLSKPQTVPEIRSVAERLERGTRKGDSARGNALETVDREETHVGTPG